MRRDFAWMHRPTQNSITSNQEQKGLPYFMAKTKAETAIQEAQEVVSDIAEQIGKKDKKGAGFLRVLLLLIILVALVSIIRRGVSAGSKLSN